MDECSGWAYLNETGSCYLFVEEKKSWTDANDYCDKLAPGATLPSIHSTESNPRRVIVKEGKTMEDY